MAVAPPLRNAAVVTARPVTAGPIAEYSPPDSLTSGYQLDPTAYGGVAQQGTTLGKYGKPLLTSGSDLALVSNGAVWQPLLDAGFKNIGGWIRNTFFNYGPGRTEGANYGSVTSVTNFAYRHQLYPANGPRWVGIAGYPGPVPSEIRPMWDNVLAIVWALRVPNPTAGGSVNSTVQAAYNPTSYNNPVSYTPPGTASLFNSGGTV